MITQEHKEKGLNPQKLKVQANGAAGEIRTLGRLLTYTRFPVVLVMTTSILLRIVVLDSENHYTKNPIKVKHKFTKSEIFQKNGALHFLPPSSILTKKPEGEGLSWEKTSIAP